MAAPTAEDPKVGDCTQQHTGTHITLYTHLHRALVVCEVSQEDLDELEVLALQPLAVRRPRIIPSLQCGARMLVLLFPFRIHSEHTTQPIRHSRDASHCAQAPSAASSARTHAVRVKLGPALSQCAQGGHPPPPLSLLRKYLALQLLDLELRELSRLHEVDEHAVQRVGRCVHYLRILRLRIENVVRRMGE